MASVDTSLPPEPTGAAAQLASAHSSPSPLKIYGGWFCPFVQRAWITLEEKGVKDYEYVEINPYKKEPEFMGLNPRGLVPTLAVPMDAQGKEQKALYESLVICEYLDEEYGSEQEKLLPRGTYERARARLWINHIATRIIPAWYKLLQHTPDKTFSLDEAREQLHKHLKAFTAEMSSGGPWFYGKTFGMVDIALAPWAKRLWLIDHYKQGGTGIPEKGEDEVWDRWWSWMAAVTERKSVKDTWSSEERYILAYKRYAEDKTNSEVGQATRGGGGLP
ncbi:glutathione S-transferase domain-containing protein [Sarocladium strictum]